MPAEDKKKEEAKAPAAAPAEPQSPKAGLDEEDDFGDFDEFDWETPAVGPDVKQWEEDWYDAG